MCSMSSFSDYMKMTTLHIYNLKIFYLPLNAFNIAYNASFVHFIAIESENILLSFVQSFSEAKIVWPKMKFIAYMIFL